MGLLVQSFILNFVITMCLVSTLCRGVMFCLVFSIGVKELWGQTVYLKFSKITKYQGYVIWPWHEHGYCAYFLRGNLLLNHMLQKQLAHPLPWLWGSTLWKILSGAVHLQGEKKVQIILPLLCVVVMQVEDFPSSIWSDTVTSNHVGFREGPGITPGQRIVFHHIEATSPKAEERQHQRRIKLERWKSWQI